MYRRMKLTSRARRLQRDGVAAVEFALFAPVLALITMGMLEIGRAVIVQQTLVNVSRESARLAVGSDTSTADIVAFANAELTTQGSRGPR